MQKENSFSSDSHFNKTLKKWWEQLDDDRGNRAILRRCSTLDEVILSPAYQRFYRYMLAHKAWPEKDAQQQRDKLAAIAGLLAHVEKNEGHLPVVMSPPGGDKPLVSELRFLNLLKMETTDDVFRGLRRILPLIKNQAGIAELARDVYWWNDRTRKEWAYAYAWPIKQAV